MDVEKQSGFTLLETLLVIAIIAILIIAIIPNFFGATSQSAVSGVTQDITAVLRQAESYSAQQVGNMPWGVHFVNATNTAPYYELFSGSSFASGTIKDIYSIPSTVAFSQAHIPLGGAFDVIFSPISGTIPIPMTIGLYASSRPSVRGTISVLTTGEVMSDSNSTPACGPTLVSYSASAVFNGPDAYGSGSGNILANGTASISYIPGSTSKAGPTPTGSGFGAIKDQGGTGTFSGDTVTITISQTSPGPYDTVSFTGTINGSVTPYSSSVFLNISSSAYTDTNPVITYAPTTLIVLVAPSSGGGITTVQGWVLSAPC